MTERATNKMADTRDAVRAGGLPGVGASLVAEMRSLISDKRSSTDRGDYLVMTGRLAGMERMLKRDDLNKEPDFELSFAQMMRKASKGKEEDTSDRFRGALEGLGDRARERDARHPARKVSAATRD